MGIPSAKNWIQQNNIKLDWQEDLGQYYGQLQDGSKTYQLWMEEETSLSAKMDLIWENDLAGVACWKLGFDTPELWGIVSPK